MERAKGKLSFIRATRGRWSPPVRSAADWRRGQAFGRIKKWSGRRGSNPRHSRWQRDALPLSYARLSISNSNSGFAANAARTGSSPARPHLSSEFYPPTQAGYRTAYLVRCIVRSAAPWGVACCGDFWLVLTMPHSVTKLTTTTATAANAHFSRRDQTAKDISPQ